MVYAVSKKTILFNRTRNRKSYRTQYDFPMYIDESGIFSNALLQGEEKGKMEFSNIVDAMIAHLAAPRYHISDDVLAHMKEIRILYTLYRIPRHCQTGICDVPVYDRYSGQFYHDGRYSGQFYRMRVPAVNQVIDGWPEYMPDGMVHIRPAAVISEDSTESMLFHEAAHLLSVGPYIHQGPYTHHAFGIRRQCLDLGEDGRFQEVETTGTYVQNEYFTDYAAGHLYTDITGRPYETPACNVIFEDYVQKYLQNAGLSGDEIISEYFSGGSHPVCNAVISGFDWSGIRP